MRKNLCTAASLAVFALIGAAGALATPVPDPVYTFCEMEDNDLCVNSQEVDAVDAITATGEELVRDCFFITGKLQEDCVWDKQPKCALRVYGKHIQCHTTNGQIIHGSFYEPLLASSFTGRIDNFPISASDRVVRLAVAAFSDALDGTVNGLNQNSPHEECGEVTIKIFHDGPGGSDRGDDEPGDQSYVYRFQNGADALRVSFVIPANVPTVDIVCCNNTGQVGVCYDVDFYTIRGLIPNKNYCITVVGGLDPWCRKTDTLLGWFDKDCQLLDSDDDGGQCDYSELCINSDGDGVIRIGVTGSGDGNFNGLVDTASGGLVAEPVPVECANDEKDYFLFHFLLGLVENIHVTFRPGASLKDDSADDVIRYPRSIWDNEDYGAYFCGESFCCKNAPETLVDHGVCGEYCIKVRLAQHVDPHERPATVIGGSPSALGADMNSDGVVNAADLAMLLSFWGPVPGL